MVMPPTPRRIRQAKARHGHLLELVYEQGETVEVDLGPLIAAGGVWAALSAPADFARVKVGPDGRYVEWPGELDLCADALWLQAHQHHTV